MYNNISEIVKNICKEQQITVSELEQQSGLSRGAIGRWKNELPKSITSLIKISQILNVSTDYLLGLDNSRSNTNNDSIMELIIHKTYNSGMEWERITYNKLPNNPLNINKSIYNSYITYISKFKNNKIVFIYSEDKYWGNKYYLFLNKNGDYMPINYMDSEIEKLSNLIIKQRRKAVLELLDDLQE